MTRVLMTCTHFEPGYKGGGPIQSAAHIVDTVPAGVDLAMITKDRDLGDLVPFPDLPPAGWVRRGNARVCYLNTGDSRQRRQLLRNLRRTRWDLLYVNSLFSTFSLVPIVAARLGVIRARRVLVAPRGELSTGALGIKSGKKQRFLRAWLPVLATMDVTWHATSEQEKADILARVPKARIELCRDQGGGPKRAAAPGVPGPVPRLVFLSRICEMKNLALALEALEAIAAPVLVDIYGPTEDEAYWRTCQGIISRLPAHVRVTYRGQVHHDQVREVLNGYDAMLLPTLGENFGHIIAEALSASCPVICSANTPWTEVLHDGGGMVADPLTADNYADVVKQIVAADVAERARRRADAGAAYDRWKASTPGRNIIEQALGAA